MLEWSKSMDHGLLSWFAEDSLKIECLHSDASSTVAPRAGAWIETIRSPGGRQARRVAPCAGCPKKP